MVVRNQIPIEAVYAYIEAKHTIELEGEGQQSLGHASDQVSKVKALCSRREPVTGVQISPYIALQGFAPASLLDNWPEIHNPPYGMVLARHVRLRPKGEPLISPEEIRRHLTGKQLTGAIDPDTMVLGSDVAVLPVIAEPEPKNLASPFFIQGKSELIHHLCEGRAFAIGLCMLLFALDWIQLGKMQWGRIIMDALLT